MMHERYRLGIIDHDTIASLIRFCLQFWMGHLRMKKHQFDMAQQDIDQEKKKLASIVAEEQAWEKWDNSTPRVMEKNVKELEQMGKDFERVWYPGAATRTTTGATAKAKAAATTTTTRRPQRTAKSV